jgi:hypothetical protein
METGGLLLRGQKAICAIGFRRSAFASSATDVKIVRQLYGRSRPAAHTGRGKSRYRSAITRVLSRCPRLSHKVRQRDQSKRYPAAVPNVDQILQERESLSFQEAEQQLAFFSSYDRTIALVFVLLRAPSTADRLETFLAWWNMCDAPWSVRTPLTGILKEACAEVRMPDLLPPIARSFCDELPALAPVWRGCERGRERGMSWTTDRSVAERFAIGQRCVNKTPTLVSAKIPKQHILGVFVDRNEKEIVLNFRRLRSVFSEPLEVPGETEKVKSDAGNSKFRLQQ